MLITDEIAIFDQAVKDITTGFASGSEEQDRTFWHGDKEMTSIKRRVEMERC